MINKETELWDIYNKNREKTGRVHRRGDRMKEGDYHLVVHVCIFNSKKQLLVQQRQPFKKGWSNMWDITVGGSAVQGDDSCRAAEREVWEELGLKLDLSGRRPNFTMNFSDGFDDYYIVEQEVDISKLCLQKDEVKQVKWVDREEAMEMQASGVMVPYWFLDKLFDIGNVYEYDAHGDRSDMQRVCFATMRNLESWMNFVEIVKGYFPGLETEEEIEDYRNTVIKNIDRGSAVCALDGNMVVGVLLFSQNRNMLSCLAVHPGYRRKGIATKMVELMLTRLDRSRDITVETFREEDEKGAAPRAFYRSFGFVPGRLGVAGEGEYPVQAFVLEAEK